MRPSRFKELVVFRFCGTRSPSISARSRLVFCSLGARFRVCTVPLRLFGFDSIFLVPLFDYIQVLFALLSSASTPLHHFPILVYFFQLYFLLNPFIFVIKFIALFLTAKSRLHGCYQRKRS